MEPIKVNGIPALAKITYYHPRHSGRGLRGPLESTMMVLAPEPEEVEYDIHDRKGYPAPWLEEMACRLDLWDDITQQILEAQ